MKSLVLFLLLVLTSACLYQGDQDFIGDSEEFSVETGPVSKEVHMVGRVRSLNSILVRSPSRAQLVKLYVGLGSIVKKGETIATISEPKNTNRLDKLIQAQGESRRVKLRKSQLYLRLKEKAKDLKSSQRLLASGSISKTEQEQAKVAYYLQKRELEILNEEEKTITQTLRLLKSNQRNSFQTLRSPVDGVITDLWVPEESITEGMSIEKDTSIVRIEEPGSFVFISDVPEPEYLKLSIGQKVQLRLTYDRAKPWYGRIKSLSPVAKASGYGVGLFTIKVSFESNNPKIKSGLEALGKIIVGRSENVLRIPRSAARIDDDGRYFASVLTDDGLVDQRFVPGVIGDNFIEVRKGLSKGTSVLSAYTGN